MVSKIGTNLCVPISNGYLNLNNYKTYACVRISATIKIVKLAIKTLHLIVVAHIRSQTTLRWRPKGSGILPKRTSALREVGLTSRVLDDVGGHADGGVDRRSRKPRNNFYKRSLAYWFLHAYLYYGILKRTRFIDT